MRLTSYPFLCGSRNFVEKLRAVIVIGFSLLANKACGYLTIAEEK
jgi:hypothetical protein